MSEVLNYKEELIFITIDGNEVYINKAYFIFDPPDEDSYIISYEKRKDSTVFPLHQYRYRELRKDTYNKTYFRKIDLNMIIEKCNKDISIIGEKHKNKIMELEKDVLLRKSKIDLIKIEMNNIKNKELTPNRAKSIREKGKGLRRLYKRIENKNNEIEKLKIRLRSLRKDTFFKLKNVLKQ
ncbi:hypothetical protein KGF51_14625 [Clostridioides sp. ZZV14-6045]|uniref:Atg14 domain-containing protein n=1 Tax=Clostridioides sp. ZZV14-6045 TaxID=2811489 RepID=UPI001D1079F3|nr:hypothetical protein [Clostridioides sp. ZZV14-6045]